MFKRIKMKVAIYTLGNPIEHNSLETVGVGGSESAAIYLARALSELVSTVHLYCRCQYPVEKNGVEYRDSANVVSLKGYDVIISSRWPSILAKSEAGVKLLWLHDMPVMLPELESSIWAIDGVLTLSRYQTNQWCSKVPLLSSLINQITNGVDLRMAKSAYLPLSGRNHQVVWGSRPERGLLNFLTIIWPKIYAKDPSLSLVVAGYSGLHDSSLNSLYNRCAHLVRSTPGVKSVGSLSKSAWYTLLGSSKAVLYSCLFPEVSCILALESQAVGTPVVTTLDWALKETVVGGELIPLSSDFEKYANEFVDITLDLLGSTNKWSALSEAGISSVVSWSSIAADLLKYIESLTNAKLLEKLPTVSAHILTKDEEANIVGCIRSIKPFVDEVVVCDTGSKDRTVDLARQEGARVVFYNSPNEFNFAEARNSALKSHHTDWVFWIDADERYVGDSFANYLTSKANHAYSITQVNFDFTQKNNDEYPVRLFRLSKISKLRGYVHEAIEFSAEVGSIPIIQSGQLAHFGYLDPKVCNDKFINRDSVLIEKNRTSGISHITQVMYEMRLFRNKLSIALRGMSEPLSTDVFVEQIKLWKSVESDYYKCLQAGDVSSQNIHLQRSWEFYQWTLKTMLSLGVRYDNSLPIRLSYYVGLSHPNTPECNYVYGLNLAEIRKYILMKVDSVCS